MALCRPSRNCLSGALRAGAVKVRSTAGRGVGAQRRDLDGAEHSATLKGVMVGDTSVIGTLIGPRLAGGQTAVMTCA